MAVADAADSVFIPAIGARARVIVRQIVPGRAICAVVFAHSAPRALTQIRSPTFPMRCPLARSLKPSLFYHSRFSSQARLNDESSCIILARAGARESFL